MSDLPSGWEWATIGELCDVNPRSFDNPPSDGDLVSVIPMAAVETESGIIDSSQTGPYGSLKSKSLTRFQEHDVLFAKITPCMENGKIAVAKGLHGGRALGSTEFHVLRSFGAVLPGYIFYYLVQKSVRVEAEGNMTGAVGQRRVQRQYLESLSVPVPPLAEQRRIIAALEDHFSRLHAARLSLLAASKKQTILRQALLDEVVLGRSLGPPADESFSELRDAKPKKINYMQLSPLPATWKWRVAGDVCESIESGGTPKADLMYAEQGEIPFLKVYNLTRHGVIDFSVRPTFIDRVVHEKLLRRSRVRPGDVLTNIVGPPLGKTVVVSDEMSEWNINQAIAAFRAGPTILPSWLAIVMRSPYIMSLLKGTARATAGQFNISLSTCREMPIPVPPLSDQVQLVEEVGDRLSSFDRLSVGIEPTLRRAEGLRWSLFSTAFTGNMVPQDPRDEPASTLIQRIRSDRSARSTAKRTRRTKADSGQRELL